MSDHFGGDEKEDIGCEELEGMKKEMLDDEAKAEAKESISAVRERRGNHLLPLPGTIE